MARCVTLVRGSLVAIASFVGIVAGCANGSVEELDEPVTVPDDGGARRPAIRPRDVTEAS